MTEYRLKIGVFASTGPVCHNSRVLQTDGQKGLCNIVRCITCSRTVKNNDLIFRTANQIFVRQL